MWRVYYHSGGRAITAQVIGGWAGSDLVSSRSRLERRMRATFGKDSENDLWRPDRYELVKKKFSGPDEDSTEVQREQHARVYILIIIGGLLMFDKLRNLIHLRWYLKLVDFREVGELSWGWNHGLSYVGLLDDLRDIQLLLDQQLEAEITKILRMHPIQILGESQHLAREGVIDIEDLYHIDLWGRTNDHWPAFHAQYINIWNNRYDFLPTCEAIIAMELACFLEYMPWFKAHGKLYLLGEEARGRQPHTRRP
ncbi:hypothetical protein Gohar_006630 [Gossypium harknessii]|uniref:Aminotransferase-like plant mobile domain-containing protein n=1 Tax=Gossypium harknessii TaxID=34285 RepID=A0A7J9GG41_9ROSI|nr:hypothetical protein [Gossypium harknessii]